MLRVGLIGLLALALGVAAALVGLALRDSRDAGRLQRALLAPRDGAPPAFDPAMIADLPEVARRYFTRAITPGTLLSRVVALEMTGEFRLNGNALPMQATQVLAAPTGFVWRAQFGSGMMRIAGSDALSAAQSWTRFGLFGLIPVARTGGNADHRRSAGTRAVMESVWAPAALLPLFGARWEQTGPDNARVWFPAMPDVAPMDLILDAQGDILALTAMRWSDANADHAFRLQPFGGRVLQTAQLGGFTIPVQVELGNLWGTAAFDDFFHATITAAAY